MGLPALEADYLFLGPLIVARIKAEVADLQTVEHVETGEQILREQRAKVGLVMWSGDVFDTTEMGRAGAGASQLVRQRWMVAVMLNNAGQAQAARHTVAGPLLSQVHKALAGWQPEGAGRTFRRAQAGLPPQFTPTHGMYPLGFEITLAL